MSVLVKLHFRLTGRTSDHKEEQFGALGIDWTNQNTLQSVKDSVAEYFGNRALMVCNEPFLLSPGRTYPKFYAAGWFISDEPDNMSELVVIAHGESMEEANTSMMECIKVVDWDEVSVRI